MSEVQSPTPVKLINQLSLNSNGSSDVDSTGQEDTEITLDQAIASSGDQADAWGFSRPNNQSQVSNDLKLFEKTWPSFRVHFSECRGYACGKGLRSLQHEPSPPGDRFNFQPQAFRFTSWSQATKRYGC